MISSYYDFILIEYDDFKEHYHKANADNINFGEANDVKQNKTLNFISSFK